MNVRYRSYDPEGAYFTLIDPRDVKRRNQLLKAIDSFVDEHVPVEPFSAAQLPCTGEFNAARLSQGVYAELYNERQSAQMWHCE